MKFLWVLVSVLLNIVVCSETTFAEIVNDEVWHDTEGEEVRNNGGFMKQIGDTFYWVGLKTGGGGGGMAMYSSTDLENWKDEGNPLPRENVSPHVSTGWMGRPGLFYNDATHKYIITWEASSRDWKRHKLGFAVSDEVTGPYPFANAMYGPDNVSFGDMGVFQEGADAYLVTTVDLDNGKTNNGLNSGTGIYKLSPDFLSIESNVVRFDQPYREPHSIIKRNGVYYWFMSETRGGKSSPTHFQTATSIEGPWSPSQRLNTSPDTGDSFNTQHDFIIPVAGPDETTTWLYVGDRYSQHHGIGVGRNIFLPLTWEEDVPTLEWRDSWTIDIAAPTSQQEREISLTISVDAGQVVKELPPGPASAVLCWLMDSDIHTKRKTSFEDAAKAMKVGSLRFPYGHLADNYLWHTPPYDDVSGGLRHKAATSSQAPGNWGWAVDKNNSFTEALDFDEFMGYCIRLNLKPVVSVNVLSYKYGGGPSYDYLKTSAVEWVKYAMKKGYEGIYWQLGNEIEHHQDLLSSSKYFKLYEDFASAMKVINPDIKIGPGILKDTNYYRGVIGKDADLVDFVCVHQYNWALSIKSYDAWKNYTGDFLDNLRRAQNGISAKPDLEILVTETDAQSGTKLPGGGHTSRSLWWFEQLMNEISFPNVTHTYFWGTHSPWGGQNQNPRSGSLLLDKDNNQTNMGKVNTFVNTHLEGQELVEVERVHGYIRAYATRTPKNDQVTVFLLNKNDVREDNVKIDINTFNEITGFKRWEFKGSTWDNYDPTYDENGSIEASGSSFTTSLEPLSVTVITVTAVPRGDKYN